MSNNDLVWSARLSRTVSLTFCLSTFLFPIILYLVVKKSRQIKRYRYYLINNVCWCYAYHSCVFVARPTFLFPSCCLTIDPLIPVPRGLEIYGFYFVFFVIINLDLSVVESLFYRWSQAFPGFLSTFFDRSRAIYGIYSAVHVSIYALIFIPLRLAYVSDEQEARVQFVTENPEFSSSVDSLVLICFVNSRLSRWFMLWIATLLISFFWIGTTLYTLLYVRMWRTKRESTISSTYRLQLMLFRAISAQLLTGYLFLLLPTAFANILIFFQAPHGGLYANVVITLMSLYAVLDYCSVMFFITPYKRTILKWLRLSDGRTGGVSIVTTTTITKIN